MQTTAPLPAEVINSLRMLSELLDPRISITPDACYEISFTTRQKAVSDILQKPWGMFQLKELVNQAALPITVDSSHPRSSCRHISGVHSFFTIVAYKGTVLDPPPILHITQRGVSLHPPFAPKRSTVSAAESLAEWLAEHRQQQAGFLQLKDLIERLYKQVGDRLADFELAHQAYLKFGDALATHDPQLITHAGANAAKVVRIDWNVRDTAKSAHRALQNHANTLAVEQKLQVLRLLGPIQRMLGSTASDPVWCLILIGGLCHQAGTSLTALLPE